MQKHLFLLAILVALLQGVAPAGASYVSVTGDDANSCALPAQACRNLSRAMQAVVDGHIDILTPGFYGVTQFSGGWVIQGVPGARIQGSVISVPVDSGVTFRGIELAGVTVNLTGSNSRVGLEEVSAYGSSFNIEGGVASISGGILLNSHVAVNGTSSRANLTNAVMENSYIGAVGTNSGVSFVKVSMENSYLYVNGDYISASIDDTISNGESEVVRFFSYGGKLSVKNSAIRNFQLTGIDINGVGATFVIEDSVIASNKGDLNAVGVKAASTNPAITMDGTIRRSALSNNAFGLRLAYANATISDTVFSRNSSDGIYLGYSGGLGRAKASVERSTFSKNVRGVRMHNGSQVNSSGDNLFVDNSRDVFGAITPITKQ